jgi:hypothetical protein
MAYDLKTIPKQVDPDAPYPWPAGLPRMLRDFQSGYSHGLRLPPNATPRQIHPFTESDLLKERGLGRAALRYIRIVLSRAGLRLGGAWRSRSRLDGWGEPLRYGERRCQCPECEAVERKIRPHLYEEDAP